MKNNFIWNKIKKKDFKLKRKKIKITFYLEEIYKLVKNYYEEEFQDVQEISDLKKENILGLAYTTDDKDNELQVNLNIKELSINYYKNNNLIKQLRYKNLKELFETLMFILAFDLLISECDPEYD